MLSGALSGRLGPPCGGPLRPGLSYCFKFRRLSESCLAVVSGALGPALRVAVASCGWLWLAVTGCGWLWLAVAGCGWLAVVGCGWLWLVMAGWLGNLLKFWSHRYRELGGHFCLLRRRDLNISYRDRESFS